ncbi:MAG: hypothetical protein M1290_07000 [Candidatus Thermoplasmatota archaeon]|jgi:hypothetical protein|nr:hypothetical protein [Candidatus Thermoplasmatota archaeon]MCL5790189.1 hypothetical protein [Candidatus Thermoplasmatota archaeon]
MSNESSQLWQRLLFEKIERKYSNEVNEMLSINMAAGKRRMPKATTLPAVSCKWKAGTGR